MSDRWRTTNKTKLESVLADIETMSEGDMMTVRGRVNRRLGWFPALNICVLDVVDVLAERDPTRRLTADELLDLAERIARKVEIDPREYIEAGLNGGEVAA